MERVDKKFVRILDKGCSGIDGALHWDAIRRIEVDGFNVYAYTDGQRYLINGYGSRMEVEKFMEMISETVDVDIEYRVREKVRTQVLGLFKGGFGIFISPDDISDMCKHDYVSTYCEETIEGLVEYGYLLLRATDNTFYRPTDPPPEAIQYMIGGVFNNVSKGDQYHSEDISISFACGRQMYFPSYPDVWVKQLYSILFDIGYAVFVEESERITPGSNVKIVNIPDSTYDEDTEIRTYDISAFVQAIKDRNERR